MAMMTTPLPMLLAALPGLPRPVLSRLTAAMVDQLDRIDGDPDLEDSWDQELTDEREREDYDGGGDVSFPYSRMHVTA
jgi:hypothetical protein